jgi:hypothetical protein
MEWTQKSAIELIELYKRIEIIWDPKHSMHFNKIRKARYMGRNGKRNEQTCR